MKETGQDKTYVLILLDSLVKKDAVLEELLNLTGRQRTLLSKGEELDMDEFEELMGLKDGKIKELEGLDQGFALIYEKVKGILAKEKEPYQAEIKAMQQMIGKITDKSVKLEATERENKKKLELYFSKKRSQIKNFKLSNKTVANYYKNMSGHTEEAAYFLDKRK